MTVYEALRSAASRLHAVGADEPMLSAEVLLAHALGVTRSALLAARRDELSDGAIAAFEPLLLRRIAREPLAYIVGTREFYGLEFRVSPAVLIPRPETEMLVDFALAEARRRGGTALLADVGTGSGAIAVSVGVHAPEIRIVATDTSAQALRVAEANVALHGVGNVDLVHADMLGDLRDIDILIANLPYVSEPEFAALPPEVRDHEPRQALLGGPCGSEAIERLLGMAPARVAPGAALALEIGPAHAERLSGVARANFPEAAVCVMKDFAGPERMLVVRMDVERE